MIVMAASEEGVSTLTSQLILSASFYLQILID
jgi:hypothetical protein